MDTLKLYESDTNSYEFLTGKSLAMFLLKDDKCIYLLRGTTVSSYMAEELKKDIRKALELGFTLSEIVELYDDSKSLEVLGTTIDVFDEYANDCWNWHLWSLNHNFHQRFWTYVSKGVIVRNF